MVYKVLATSRSRFGLGFEDIGRTVAILSFLALAGALAIEYIGGIAPCPLCLDQRIAYYAAIPLGLIAFALADGRRDWSRAILVLLAAGFALNAAIGIYHSGIEWGWWPGPDACSGAGSIAASPRELLESLQQPRVVRCDEAPIRIFGLSLAGYSAVLSGALAFLRCPQLSRTDGKLLTFDKKKALYLFVLASDYPKTASHFSVRCSKNSFYPRRPTLNGGAKRRAG